MKHSRNPQNEINYWQSKFRILRGWQIEYDNTSQYKREVTRAKNKRLATIYGWGVGHPSKDYIFHEVLHLCQYEIRDAKDYKDRRELEEMYIQDVCKVFRKLFKEKDIRGMIDEEAVGRRI